MKAIPIYQKHKQGNKKLHDSLPDHDDHTPYLYFLINRKRIVYIGQSASIRLRIHSHNCYFKFNKIRLIPCRARVISRYERRWIEKFQPEYNIMFTRKAA